ncbi:MAG: transposase, partial [Alistipes sp.]|nr:transposase [Alistipes sp.]
MPKKRGVPRPLPEASSSSNSGSMNKKNGGGGQMCNYCKSINPAVKDLSVREWICPQCGTAHDRD